MLFLGAKLRRIPEEILLGMLSIFNNQVFIEIMSRRPTVQRIDITDNRYIIMEESKTSRRLFDMLADNDHTATILIIPKAREWQ